MGAEGQRRGEVRLPVTLRDTPHGGSERGLVLTDPRPGELRRPVLRRERDGALYRPSDLPGRTLVLPPESGGLILAGLWRAGWAAEHDRDREAGATRRWLRLALAYRLLDGRGDLIERDALCRLYPRDGWCIVELAPPPPPGLVDPLRRGTVLCPPLADHAGEPPRWAVPLPLGAMAIVAPGDLATARHCFRHARPWALDARRAFLRIVTDGER